MTLKILFKGSYSNVDITTKSLINEYAEQLAISITKHNHQLIFDGARELDLFIANIIFNLLGEDKKQIKNNVVFMMPNGSEIPKFGVVKRYEIPKYWSSSRTYIVSMCDILITIGGDEGTVDCIEKAMLCRKPVFIADKINGYPKKIWERYYFDDEYYFIKKGDADYILDYNLSPADFIDESFRIMNEFKVGHPKYFLDRERQKKMVEDWRGNIIKGNLKKALKDCLKISKRVDNGLSNQLISLFSQFNLITKEQSLGISERIEEINRITYSFLKIIDELDSTV